MCETNLLESLTLKALDKLLVDYSNHLLLVGQTINFVVFYSTYYFEKRFERNKNTRAIDYVYVRVSNYT